ncbi:hypothetical protein [Solirhodobacter olei]|uniref:hypothetical protein n=1 Tax=Solirhodobacter olei TaxID=2493082 RepID=UPI001F4EA128|nr:hypothetical protein [Solirhodobacter olei]
MAPKLYDCFPFFNEFDLLEIRLNELDGVVDSFVIIEAGETFSGKPKPYWLEENFDRFSQFRDKIIHLKIDRFPPKTAPWERERLQRDKLLEGLREAGPNDLIMLCDADEIPRADVLAGIKCDPPMRGEVLCLELRWFFFFLNMEKRERWLRLGPRVIQRAGLTGMQDLRYVRGPADRYFRDLLRCWKARWGMRRWITRRAIHDAGWHFTWLGGRDAVAIKAGAIPFHSRLPRNMERQDVAQQVIDGSVAAVGTDYDIVPVDESFPLFVQQNRKLFSRHILEG